MVEEEVASATSTSSRVASSSVVEAFVGQAASLLVAVPVHIAADIAAVSTPYVS